MEANAPGAGKRFSAVLFTVAISLFMVSLLVAQVQAAVVGGQVGASANPGGSTGPAVNHAPPAPTLVSPVNGSSNDTTTVVFRWNTVNDQDGNMVSYRLDVDTRSDFSARYSVMGNDATELMPLTNNTHYYWRVGAYDGKVFNFSDTWQFSIGFHTTPPATNQTNNTNSTNTTVTKLTTPTLTSPTNAAEINASPTLSWSSVTNATSYELLLWKTATPSTMIVNTTSTSASYSTVSKNLAEGTYAWKVRALGSVPAATSAWSSEWTFKLNFSYAQANNQTTCTPSWSCSSWSTCSGTQTRTCTDANSCGTTTNRPALSQSCTVTTTSGSSGGGGGGGGGSTTRTTTTNTTNNTTTNTAMNQSTSNTSSSSIGGSDTIIIEEEVNETTQADVTTNETVGAPSDVAGTQLTGLAGAAVAYGPYAAGLLAVIAVVYLFFTRFGVSFG